MSLISDSFYEILLKSFIMYGDTADVTKFNESYQKESFQNWVITTTKIGCGIARVRCSLGWGLARVRRSSVGSASSCCMGSPSSNLGSARLGPRRMMMDECNVCMWSNECTKIRKKIKGLCQVICLWSSDQYSGWKSYDWNNLMAQTRKSEIYLQKPFRERLASFRLRKLPIWPQESSMWISKSVEFDAVFRIC